MHSNSSLLHGSLSTYFTSKTLLNFRLHVFLWNCFVLALHSLSENVKLIWAFFPSKANLLFVQQIFSKNSSPQKTVCACCLTKLRHTNWIFCSLVMEITWNLLISCQWWLMIFFTILEINQGWLLINELFCHFNYLSILFHAVLIDE